VSGSPDIRKHIITPERICPIWVRGIVFREIDPKDLLNTLVPTAMTTTLMATMKILITTATTIRTRDRTITIAARAT
jgi:hypothetical protein